MSFLLFLSNVGNSFSMTEIFFINLFPLLILFLNINSTIPTRKNKELITSLNPLLYTLLLLMSFITNSLPSYIPLVETSNGILIFMLLSLLAVLIKLFDLLKLITSMLILLLINGSFLFSILFPRVYNLTIRFV